MTKTNRQRNWTPVASSDGVLYCSPACGGRCTRVAYLDAQHRAAALARALGESWKPSVWENLGWHYSVHAQYSRRTMIALHPHTGRSWAALYIDDRQLFTAEGPTPRRAVNALLDVAREMSQMLTQALKEIGA